MDPYAYVGGNPETKTDPTGHIIPCEGDCGGGIANPPASGCGPCHDPKKPYPGSGSGSTTQPTPQPTTQPTRSGSASKKTPQKAGGCGGTSILGLCVKDVGKFAQGSAEVFGSVLILIGAVIGVFQSGGLLWFLAQGFQIFASGILAMMRNGISNILNSLSGPPSKFFKVVLDILQIAADLTSIVITGVGIWKNVQQIGKYPGKTFSTSWGGFWKVTNTLVAKGTLNATTALAINTVGSVVNSLTGVDMVFNDGQQLLNDLASS